MLSKLQGKRTYVVALAIAILNLLVAFEVISPQNLEYINMVLGALGLAALRSGVSNQ